MESTNCKYKILLQIITNNSYDNLDLILLNQDSEKENYVCRPRQVQVYTPANLTCHMTTHARPNSSRTP